MCAPLFEISQYIRKVSKAKSDVSRAVISYYHAAQKSQADTAYYHVRIVASAPFVTTYLEHLFRIYQKPGSRFCNVVRRSKEQTARLDILLLASVSLDMRFISIKSLRNTVCFQKLSDSSTCAFSFCKVKPFKTD